MKKLKAMVIATLAATGALGAPAASAYYYEVWTGASWSTSGSTHFIGPVTVSMGGPIPPIACNADFTAMLRMGIIIITDAKFSGSAQCVQVTAQNLPWLMHEPTPYAGPNPPFSGAPFLSFTLWSEGVLESKIYVPQTNSYYTISNVVLDMGTQSTPPLTANRIVFQVGTGVYAFRTSATTPPYALTVSPAIRVNGSGQGGDPGCD